MELSTEEQERELPPMEQTRPGTMSVNHVDLPRRQPTVIHSPLPTAPNPEPVPQPGQGARNQWAIREAHITAPLGPDIEYMSPQEQQYLTVLEDKNRELTMSLGDAIIKLDADKAVLAAHRRSMQEAYANSLRMRGVKTGHFDTANGLIRVASRHE